MTENKSLKITILNGLKCKCPGCGKGKLFYKYLKQVDKCDNCNEKLENYKAEDGPAWLTLILVGHILAPFMMKKEIYNLYSTSVCIAFFIAIGTFLTLFLLPRAKGLFIAVLWHIDRKSTTK